MDSKGITLIELLIVMGIMGIIMGITSLYFSQYKGSQDLDSDLKRVVAVFRDAEERAITQENSLRWGVRLVNNTTPPDFFYLISASDTLLSSEGPGTGSVATLITTYPFETTVEINSGNLANGSYRDFIFEKRTGELVNPPPPITPNLILDRISNTADTRTITVNANGTVTY